jgi:hypothetical protein
MIEKEVCADSSRANCTAGYQILDLKAVLPQLTSPSVEELATSLNRSGRPMSLVIPRRPRFQCGGEVTISGLCQNATLEQLVCALAMLHG